MMRIAGLSLGAWLLAGGAVSAAPPAPPSAQPARAAPAVAAAPVATPAVTPLGGGHIFISPMGEPFRGADGVSGAEEWFRKADANHDNRITPEEFEADAMRFFATLDTDRDGEIGPDEISHYESDVAPEIRGLLGAPGARVPGGVPVLGGVRVPGGVRVAMTSPGCSVMKWLM